MKIYTHAGIFHGDEVFAAAGVRVMCPDVEVRRVRSLEEAGPDDLVVDIGGVYDGSTRFDHHQKEGTPPPRENGCPRSSFGSLWGSEWGRDIVGSVLSKYWEDAPFGAVDEVRTRVDKSLVQGVDALDAGATTLLPSEGEVCPMSVSHMISSFNPGWDEDQSQGDVSFEKAVGLAKDILLRAIVREISVVKAKDKVLEARTADAGRVLILEEYVPWEEHIFARPQQEHLLYVVFPSLRGGWMVQQVPEKPGSFKGRKPLPESWAGLQDDAFVASCGIPDAVFCHPGRFICGAKSRHRALDLAASAIDA